MPKFKIEKNTNLEDKEAFRRIKEFLNDDPDLKKMDPSYKCQFDETNLRGTATGSKFKAQLSVSHSSSTTVCIEVDLPIFLTPFKGLVESTLEKKMDHALKG
jgi:hypothetical protein